MNIERYSSPNNMSRCGWKPDIIVCHITDGGFSGSVDWLCNRQSGVSSHFVVGRDGRIAQLVDIRSAAWCNGTQSGNPFGARYVGRATAALVRQRKANANLYTISIECEGNSSTHGILTDAQFNALVWLIPYIRQQVKVYYGIDIPLDRQHIIGHCEITPREKPDCPGRDFPYDRVIGAVNPAALPIIGVIDQADAGAVQGWTLNASRVDIYMDNNVPLGSARTFFDRPDVARVYPQYQTQQCGYRFAIPCKIAKGTHTIKAANIGKYGGVNWVFKTFEIK